MCRNRSQSKKLSQSQNRHPFKYLRRAEYRRPPNGMPHRRKNRNLHQHHLTVRQTIWSMYQASVGWKVKAPTMSNTPRTCTRTVIKSAAWDKRKAVRYWGHAQCRTAYSVSFSNASLKISWTRISEMTSQINRSVKSISSIHVVWVGI